MKTTNNALIAALAAIALSLFAGSAQAQYKAVGDDGIAASPRLRERLDEYQRNHASTPATAEVTPMPCAKCKDKVTTRVDYSARGANKPTIRVVTHLCEGCGTDWAVVGHGKAKQAVATHSCTSCGADTLACCNTTKGGLATKGMKKSLEVAPLK